MSNFLTSAFLQALDASANPFVSGTLTIYQSGTTTPLSLFSNEGLTTPLANPLTADAYGVFPTAFIAETRFKAVLKNSAGTTIRTVDPVFATGRPDNIAADDVSFDGSGIGFSSTNVQDALEEAAATFEAKLADPNADRIKFWDDSAGTMAWLALGTGLSISGTTLSPLTYSLAIQAFTGNGTYTPTTGMKYCLVFATGSGGGGGGADSDGSTDTAGGGGGAGGTAIGIFSAATIGASQAVTIGAAGTAGAAAGGGGGGGGNTTFGALLTGSGGNGGSGSGSAPGSDTIGLGGTGGSASSGTVNIEGGAGATGYADVAASGGVGGASFWGGGGRGGATFSGLAAGNAGQAYGSGGGGAADVDNTTGAAGGAGKAGIVVVLELVAV